MCNVLCIKWWRYTTQPLVPFNLLFLTWAGTFYEHTFFWRFFPVSFKHCTYLSFLFACWYYLPIISIPIIVSSAYLFFHILLCLIIPWLQWLPLLWGMYTCNEWFPKHASQKHSGLFCLASLMPQKYSGLFFTTSPMFKLNKNKATKQSHKPTGYAPSKICWLNFWAPFLGLVGQDILNPVLSSVFQFCPIEITARSDLNPTLPSEELTHCK